jgi:hypothetical protein
MYSSNHKITKAANCTRSFFSVPSSASFAWHSYPAVAVATAAAQPAASLSSPLQIAADTTVPYFNNCNHASVSI